MASGVAGQGGRAGASERCKHAIRDGWSTEVAESFGFPPRSIAGSSVVTSDTGHYELSEHVVASTDFLPASIQEPVSTLHLECRLVNWTGDCRSFRSS